MRKLVIIEEDRDFALAIRTDLESQLQYSVARIINNEQEANEWINAGGLNAVQCVLLNLALPPGPHDRQVSSLCGLRLIQDMRRVHRFSGVILVLTNTSNLADGERALSAGCDSYLCKPANDIETIAAEIRLALRGDLMMISRTMRHVFMRAELSAKEARLMDLLSSGHSWQQVAHELDYKTAKAAANIGYRVFDKLLTDRDRSQSNESKRGRALERWKARVGLPVSPAALEPPTSLSNP